MRAVILALGLLMCAGRGYCATADGTLITNMASMTFGDWTGLMLVPVQQTYGASAPVFVATPQIQLRKTAAPTMQCVGGTITYCIVAVNTSAIASAFNVIVDDYLPGFTTEGIGYITGSRAWGEWKPAGVTINYGSRYYSGGFWYTYWVNWGNCAGDCMNAGQSAPYYIRWSVDVLGPGRSAQVCFGGQVL